MNRPRRYDLILGLPLGFMMAGCAGITRPDLGLRTTPSIGDRPLAVVNGRPGEDRIIRSESESGSFTATNDSRRISGRVIDHRGQPVSGATVRLADGSLNGGMVSDVLTDDAGGFTIRGLRSSTPYTVIAALDLGGESRVGRARFLAGETQARILIEPDTAALAGSKAGSVSPAPVSTTSRDEKHPASPNPKVPNGRWVYVVEGDESESTDNTKFAAVAVKNRPERLTKASYIPMDDESEEVTPQPQEAPPSRFKSKNSQWNSRTDRGDVARAEKVDRSIVRAQFVGEEDENPLPPAIERKAYVYEDFDDPRPSPKVAMSRRPGVVASTGVIDEEMAPLREIPPPAEEINEIEDRQRSGQPRRQPAESQGGSEPRPGRESTFSDYPSAANLRVENIEEANRLRRAARARSSSSPDKNMASDRFATADRYISQGESETRRSATWQDAQGIGRQSDLPRTDRTVSLANRSDAPLTPPIDLPSDSMPALEAEKIIGRGMERSPAQKAEVERALNAAPSTGVLAQIEPDVARSDQERIDRLKASGAGSDPAFNGDSPRTSNEWLNRMTSKIPFWSKSNDTKSAAGISSAFCDFDTANQRLLDFELMNVQGKTERFSQMPADLTLVFFWGTWCKPCHEAMPHLVELQKQLAPDNFQIVGIAYEEGVLADRQKKVAMAADRYGINFPLLMGNSAGAESCPVRKAFEVRVYPTMVLLDRSGRVLWKDQGITPASLGRLDRVLASHLRELDSQKYARADNGRVNR